MNIGFFMQLHNIKQPDHIKDKKRIGRGGKHGNFCGKGDKGQKSRAGEKIRPAIRDWIKSIPKLRGFDFNSPNEDPEVVNVEDLESHFEKGDLVNPNLLAEKGLIKNEQSSVKILGRGEIETELEFENVNFSDSAEKKVKDAGGSVA